jgi:hypothetical protein
VKASPEAAAFTGRRLALWVAAVIAFAAIAFTTRLALREALAERASWPRDVDRSYLPRANVLRLLGLGHHEMLADLVAARANVYFGAQIASRGEQRWLEQALDTAIDLDPHFHRLYLRAAAMLVYTGQAFTVQALLSANRFLERGAREFPGDWELPFQRGFNLLFELPRLTGEDDSRVADWRQQGVDALRQAARLDGAPPWLANLAARMLTRQGGEELAIRHLEQTFAQTSNEETRAEIARRLGEMRGRSRAAALEQSAAQFRGEIEARFPYAPESFSIIVGARQFSRGREDDRLDPSSFPRPTPIPQR